MTILGVTVSVITPVPSARERGRLFPHETVPKYRITQKYEGVPGRSQRSSR